MSSVSPDPKNQWRVISYHFLENGWEVDPLMPKEVFLELKKAAEHNPDRLHNLLHACPIEKLQRIESQEILKSAIDSPDTQSLQHLMEYPHFQNIHDLSMRAVLNYAQSLNKIFHIRTLEPYLKGG